MLPVLLALVAQVTAPVTPPPAPDPAVLELESGRAVLVTGSHPGPVTSTELRLGEESQLRGPGLLELTAGARAHLRWQGRLSLRLEGPAFLDWGPSQELGAPPGSLSLRFDRLAGMDLETREGRHTLHLPGQWRARVESTSFHLAQRAGGGFDLTVHAGRAVAMEWRGDPTRARPPVLALAGRPVHFHRPATSPPDDQRLEHAWREPTWPWAESTAGPDEAAERARMVALLDRHALGPRPWPDPAPGSWIPGESALVPGLVDPNGTAPARPVDPSSLPPWLREVGAPSDVVPATPLMGGPPVGAPRRAPSADRPGPAPEPPAPAERGWLEPGEDPPVALEDYRVDDWRGVPRQELVWADGVVVQQVQGVEVRRLSRGRVKVLVDADAPGVVWAFSREHDVRLEPGAVVTFREDGTLQTRIGSVDTAVPKARRPLQPAP